MLLTEAGWNEIFFQNVLEAVHRILLKDIGDRLALTKEQIKRRGLKGYLKPKVRKWVEFNLIEVVRVSDETYYRPIDNPYFDMAYGWQKYLKYREENPFPRTNGF